MKPRKGWAYYRNGKMVHVSIRRLPKIPGLLLVEVEIRGRRRKP